MKPCRHTISCFLAVLCLFLTRSCDSGLDDLLELQRIMIPVKNWDELRTAAAIDGAVIGIIDNIEIPLPIEIEIIGGKNIAITAFTQEVVITSSFNDNFFKVTAGKLILGDKRSTGKLILDGNNYARSNPLISINGVTASCIMKDGVILQNNDASSTSGGVYIFSGTFTMEGGIIRNNKTSSVGGGVGVGSNGTFFMSGGTICDNISTSGSGGGGGVASDGKFFMSGGTIYKNTTTDLTSGGGGGVNISGGVFNMSGGTIRNNTAHNNGGGICVTVNGEFTMSNGTIRDNTAFHGGGVYIFNTMSHIITGNARIINNTVTSNGGGICLMGGSINMYNGTISGNEATNSLTGYGGGVFLSGMTTFTMHNGRITGNTAGFQGGGVFKGITSTFTLNGGAVTGNFAPLDSDINP